MLKWPRLGVRSLFTDSAYSQMLYKESSLPPLVLHCHFTKNNTLYTLSRRVSGKKDSKAAEKPFSDGELVIDQSELIDRVRPHQEVVLHMSAGQAGFSGKRQRTPEAAFTATTRLFDKMLEKGVLKQPIEIVVRDFGPTRQVFFNVLFGREGAKVRPFIKRITDATRIKFGGDRSRNRPRK